MQESDILGKWTTQEMEDDMMRKRDDSKEKYILKRKGREYNENMIVKMFVL